MKTKLIKFLASPQLLERIDAQVPAVQSRLPAVRITRSAVVRIAVEEWLKREEEKTEG